MCRPCAGTALLTSRHFPDEFQGNFLDCNVISFQGIYRVKMSEDGSGLKGQTLEDLISSTDPNFRPTAVNVGPDGAIYVADMYEGQIAHLRHHEGKIDITNGRIYRLSNPEAKPRRAPKLALRRPRIVNAEAMLMVISIMPAMVPAPNTNK